MPTYEACHVRRAIASIKAAYFRSGLPKHAIVRRDLQALQESEQLQPEACGWVAGDRQIMKSCVQMRRARQPAALAQHWMTRKQAQENAGKDRLCQMHSSCTCMHQNWCTLTSLVQYKQLATISSRAVCGLCLKGLGLTVRSQIMCSTCPPPTAYPATMATTGLEHLRICICTPRHQLPAPEFDGPAAQMQPGLTLILRCQP